MEYQPRYFKLVDQSGTQYNFVTVQPKTFTINISLLLELYMKERPQASGEDFSRWLIGHSGLITLETAEKLQLPCEEFVLPF